MEGGIPLVWTPSVDVIRALLDAPDAVTRRAVLEQHSGTIVEHCCSVLADVERDDLKPEIGFLNDCLDSIDSGKYPAAQALASTVLDTVLRAMVRADASLQNGRGYFDYQVLTTQMRKAPQRTPSSASSARTASTPASTRPTSPTTGRRCPRRTTVMRPPTEPGRRRSLWPTHSPR
ncbi:hypothetical protein ABZY05_42355 [Streptomyces canus]|uniref:hypothetical protein n=1 Tax=Streptomyces canus TaxID=58343 RepID=UPI0033AD3CC5